MKLKIVTPERVVLDEDVDAVNAHAADGRLGILPRHVPLVTPLNVSVLEYAKNGETHPVAVMGGMLSTNGDEVTILSNAAELTGEIDRLRAEQARNRAEARLKERLEDVDTARAERALARAMTRLKASGSLISGRA